MKLMTGDCIEEMRNLKPNSIDCIVCDPPYGLSFMGSEWDDFRATKQAKSQVVKNLGTGMKKTTKQQNTEYQEWVGIWANAAMRVAKPGAFMFYCMTPRQDLLSRAIAGLGDAGWDIGFSSISWVYASGFPKAHNIAKIIDKREHQLNAQDYAILDRKKPKVPCVDKSGRTVMNYTKGVIVPDEEKKNGTGGISRGAVGVKRIPAWIPAYQNVGKVVCEKPGIQHAWFDKGANSKITHSKTVPFAEKAVEFNGAYGGCQMKPACETIIVAMKPLNSGGYADQALKNGKGITWMDKCRVPYENDKTPPPNANVMNPSTRLGEEYNGDAAYFYNEQFGYMQVFNEKGRFPANIICSDDVLNDGRDRTTWKPEKLRDDYESKEGFRKGKMTTEPYYNDSGSFSRYFDLDKWFSTNLPEAAKKTFPNLIIPKPSKAEKNMGLDKLENKKPGAYIRTTSPTSLERFQGQPTKNNHCTVKPVKLMAYLITMGSQKGDTILDPFLGSGTTGIAAELLGRDFVGIEIGSEYMEIAKPRISDFENYRKFIVERPKESHYSQKIKTSDTLINKFMR